MYNRQENNGSRFAFKLCIFGSGGVGKTTLIRRFVTKIFEEDIKMTIGADFSIKHVTVEGKKVTLRIWDFAGEERFRVLLPSFAKGADGGVFMFDITRNSSLKNLPEWLDVFKQGEGCHRGIPIIMIGGKLDLHDRRSVYSKDAVDLAHKYNLYDYLECSAKTGENVEIFFHKLTRVLMERAGMNI